MNGHVSVEPTAITAVRRVAAKAEAELWVASPFVTRGVVGELLALVDEHELRLRVITALSERSIRQGVLQIGGLRDLIDAGSELRSLPNLHAKVVVADTDHCLVGSGNATHRGMGLSASSNIELGTYISGPVVVDVRAAVELWWSAAEPISRSALEPYEALEVDPEVRERRAGLVHGQPLCLPVDGSTASPTDAAANDLWLKPMYGSRQEDEWWRNQTWMSTVHRFDDDGRALRKPSIRAGHRLVLYIAGTERCPAVYRVTSDPEFRTRGATADETAVLERWGWRFDVELVVSCGIDDAPTLGALGIENRSVRQQSHIRISAESFEVALETIGVGEQVTTPARTSRPVRAPSTSVSEAEFRADLAENDPEHHRELAAFCQRIERAGARVSLKAGKTMWLGEDGNTAVNPSVWRRTGDVGVDFRHLWRSRVARADLERLATALEGLPQLRPGVAYVRAGEFDRWLSCRPLVEVDGGLDALADLLIEFARA